MQAVATGTGSTLAVWLARIVRAGVWIGLAGLVGLAGVTVLAGAAGLSGGRIGPVVVGAEWRALTPALMSGFLHMAALVAVCRLLGALLATVSAGEPFDPANAGRLRWIALWIGVLELGRHGVQALSGLIVVLAGQPESGRIDPGFSPNLAAWAGVAVLLLLAQIFAEGARLRDLDRLTV